MVLLCRGDGAGRGTFAHTVSSVLRHQGHPGWLELKYAIFDVPDAPGSFRMRLQKAASWVARHHTPYAFLIPQTPIEDAAHLSRHLDEVVAHGGEGLIVRDPKGE